MPAEPRRPSPGPGDPPAEAVDRAAAIDDFFGGFASELSDDAPASPADLGPLPGSLDLLLLLRQTGSGGGRSRANAQPDSIGRYRIRRLVGQGGFSMVWEAFDPLLRRRVAVKVCTPDALLAPAVRRRFRREAELASRLVHPHIVAIHEVGEADGLEFITSEFCPSGSLADWLAARPGPVPPTVAVRIARALAHAAAHAHHEGIIHRDIKPSNVLLTPAAGDDCIIPAAGGDPAAEPSVLNVKLGDFGLGRQSDPGPDEDPLTQLTIEGSRIGTPAWMAPEQIDGSFGVVGPPTDVHAIGLLLDRMLTGRPLRGGKTDIETYREVLLDDPPAADRVVHGVPPDLGAVCLKCLAKRPSARYGSAAELADDLGRWLAGLPTLARPLSPLRRIGRGIVRRRWVAGFGAAAAVATIVAGWAALQRDLEHRQVEVQRDEIRRQTAAAELRRGFESLRAANVAGALEQIAKTRAIDPVLADSVATRWLERRLHGEREIVLRPALSGGSRPDLHSLAISAEGRVVVAGGADGAIRAIRPDAGGSAIGTIRGHDEVNDVCVSSDGRLIASVGQDGLLRWWSADGSPTSVGGAPAAGCPLYAVAFAHDDRMLWYGGEDRVLRRVSIDAAETPEEVCRLPPAGDANSEIEALVATGRQIVVANGGSLTAVDERDGRVVWSWSRGTDDPRPVIFHALAASPDGRLVAAGGTDRGVGIWEMATGRLVALLPPHPHWIQACSFSSDGSLLATACRDGIVRIFDTSTWQPVDRLVGHAGRVWDIGFEPGGGVFSAGADGTLRRWDPFGQPWSTMFRNVPVSGHMIQSVCDATTDGESCRVVAVRLGDGPVWVDLSAGMATEIRLDGPTANTGVAFDRPRKRVAFGCRGVDGRAVPLVIPLDAPRAIPQLSGRVGRDATGGPSVCWTPDGRLVTNAHDGRTYAWTAGLDRVDCIASSATGSERVAASSVIPTRIAVSGRPAVIITADSSGFSADRTVPIEDVGEPITAMAWSPDGDLLVCGYSNGTLHLFDGVSGRRIGTLAPHERRVLDVAWSPDGRVLLSADSESLRISDIATLTAFDEVRPGWTIASMCLAGQGRFVVVGGHADPEREARLAVLDLERP